MGVEVDSTMRIYTATYLSLRSNPKEKFMESDQSASWSYSNKKIDYKYQYCLLSDCHGRGQNIEK